MWHLRIRKAKNNPEVTAEVSSGSLKILQTRWLKQQKFIFLQFWRLGSPQSRFQQIQYLVRVQMAVFLLSPHMTETATSPGVFSYKGTNPIMRAPPSSKPNDLPKAPSPNIITMRVSASTYEILGGEVYNLIHISHVLRQIKIKSSWLQILYFLYYVILPQRGECLMIISLNAASICKISHLMGVNPSQGEVSSHIDSDPLCPSPTSHLLQNKVQVLHHCKKSGVYP